MIARSWHGRVSAEKSDAYLEYLRRTGIADYKSAPGNRGVWVLRTVKDGVAEFLIITFWDSLDAIRNFAGDDVERARYYPGADDWLLEKEPTATHWEIFQD